jgi:hypothetical protein
MHGSKAFLEQLACKLLIQVELADKKSESRTDHNIIISQLIRRKLTNEEKKCLCANLELNVMKINLKELESKLNLKYIILKIIIEKEIAIAIL